MHALEWIVQHGRFLRTVGADRLRRLLGRVKGCCTWCDGELSGNRRCWCSAKCLDAFKDRCWPTQITRKIKARDKGVCALCGIDTKESAELLDKIKLNVGPGCLEHHSNYRLRSERVKTLGPTQNQWSRPAARKAYWRKVSGICCCIACVARREYPTGWEADHIVPVVEGGGLCGIEGYRTLCIACHHKETAKLAARRATSRQRATASLFAECVA